MVVVRTAERADAERLLAIYAPYVEETAVSFELEVPSVDAFFGRITDGRFACLVAEVEGDLAGYAYGGPHRSRGAYRFCTETSVYVATLHRRKGVARKLYPALFDALAEKGFVNAYAGIALPNPASVALHEALGFSKVGVYERIGFKLGRWHDVVWYQRRLREVDDPS